MCQVCRPQWPGRSSAHCPIARRNASRVFWRARALYLIVAKVTYIHPKQLVHSSMIYFGVWRDIRRAPLDSALGFKSARGPETQFDNLRGPRTLPPPGGFV